MLPKSKLPDFVEYLSELGENLEKSSKYQLASVSINKAKILVYQSGVIIFEDNPALFDKIGQFLEEHGIENPDFEKYEAVETTDEGEKGQGWDETPKGVWLTDDQRDHLISTLGVELTLEEGGKHERGRYIKGEQVLVINNSGVVYTIGGFDGIINILKDVITDINPYSKYERIVVIDEQGRWERLGPLVFVLSDIMAADMVELQLAGIKDDSKSRNIDHIELMPIVEEFSSYQSLLLTPEEINGEVESREQYLDWTDQKMREFIDNQILNLNQDTLVVIDANMRNLIDHDHVVIVDRDNRNTPAIGVTSTVSNALIDKWRQDLYLQSGLEIDRHNLDKIRSHPQKVKFAKLFLL